MKPQVGGFRMPPPLVVVALHCRYSSPTIFHQILECFKPEEKAKNCFNVAFQLTYFEFKKALKKKKENALYGASCDDLSPVSL